MTRALNFNAGPSTLPLPVLERVREELLDYRNSGMSILESSHRSPEYGAINDEAIALVRELFGLGPEHHVLFLTGGASMQFAQIPLNFLEPDRTAAYVDTGSWSTKAIAEARTLGRTHVAYSGKEAGYRHIPADSELDLPAECAYVHFTTNNTIKGSQFHRTPAVDAPLIADMSSDVASIRRDFASYAMFYAGAQKNLGPAGVTLVVIHDEFLRRARTDVPAMLGYRTHAEKKSLYNTPPCFAVYVVKLVLEWVRSQGGIEGVEDANRRKQALVYQAIDDNPDFFRGTVEPEARSWMNVTLRLPDEVLERRFVDEARESGLVGLKGHRSVGGIRISLYNAMPFEGAERIVSFMRDFMGRA